MLGLKRRGSSSFPPFNTDLAAVRFPRGLTPSSLLLFDVAPPLSLGCLVVFFTMLLDSIKYFFTLVVLDKFVKALAAKFVSRHAVVKL